MFRIALQNLLPFLLPFLAYISWRWLSTRGRGFLTDTPWYMLTVIGLVLVIVSFIGLALVDEGPVDGTYVPARIEDGRIVPGYFEPR